MAKRRWWVVGGLCKYDRYANSDPAICQTGFDDDTISDDGLRKSTREAVTAVADLIVHESLDEGVGANKVRRIAVDQYLYSKSLTRGCRCPRRNRRTVVRRCGKTPFVAWRSERWSMKIAPGFRAAVTLHPMARAPTSSASDEVGSIAMIFLIRSARSRPVKIGGRKRR